jgi:GTPase SAR1 family protein/predicted RNA-binding protein with PIN domain
MESHNPQLQLAFDFVQYTNTNIFLTGKAGTGKTTFLKNLKQQSPKRMVVVAPTGVAAINAGGVTIHSFFQLPFSPFIPHNNNQTTQPSYRFSSEKIKIIKSLDLLVIDEISMVRSDVLDAIDDVLRRYRDHNKAFGGVQLLLIGDLQQLAPVVKDEEMELLRPYYETSFFFSSTALKRTRYVGIELKHIYRQSDQAFIAILNQVRENRLDFATMEALNKRFIPNFNPDKKEGYITLTTHNYQAKSINDAKLQNIKEKEYRFTATIEGEFPEYLYPNDYELRLKVGAQVMFTKNDSSLEKLFYNGKIGEITAIDNESILVKCPTDIAEISVSQGEWKNTKYTINEQTKEITETVIGSFTQYPLKAAWAITIHKSQGLTFEKAIIDANSSFAHGQVYVALSRCKTLEGLVLSSRISPQSIKSDGSVLGFSKNIEENQPTEHVLNESKQTYIRELLFELFDFQPILRRLNYSIKIYNENAAQLNGTLLTDMESIKTPFINEVIGVSDKFIPQLQQLLATPVDLEKNAALHERVSKAAMYFTEKVETFATSIQKSTVVTDNKAVRKTIIDTIDKLQAEIVVKRASLRACHTGFSIKQYVSERAKAGIEEQPKKVSDKKTKYESSGEIPTNQLLFDKLRSWRNAKAMEQNVPAYVIMHQNHILSISELLPITIDQLAQIKGVGVSRAKKFGEELIAIVTQHCNESNITPVFETKGLKIETKKTKEDTKKISFDMFKLGNSVSKIALERGLTTQTIEGHLATYVMNGQLEITELIAADRFTLIEQTLTAKSFTTLTEAKNELGETISWDELRLVAGYLKTRSPL